MKLSPSLNIWELKLSMSFNDTNGGRQAYSRHSHIRSQNYHCLQCLSNLDTSFFITWKLCDFFCFDKGPFSVSIPAPSFMKQIWDICKGSSIKKRSEKVTINFHWLLRILKLSKLYIKDGKEYLRTMGGGA